MQIKYMGKVVKVISVQFSDVTQIVSVQYLNENGVADLLTLTVFEYIQVISHADAVN